MSTRLLPALATLLVVSLSSSSAYAAPGTPGPSKVVGGPTLPTAQPVIRPPMRPTVIVPYIAPPTQVQITGDTNVCADHGGLAGAFACGAAFQQSWTVLVWNWQAPASYSDPQHPDITYDVVHDIDGFHAYQVIWDGKLSRHDRLVSTASGGPQVTMTGFPPVSSAQACFIVRAFKGQQESADSQMFCLGSGQQPTPITIFLPPSASRTIRHYHETGLPFCGVPHSGAALYVGFMHCNEGPDQAQEVWRALMSFDTGSLGTVFSAHLRFHRESTAIQGTDPYDNNNVSTAPQDEPLHGRTDANCATEVLLPQSDWLGWDDSDPQAAPPVTDLPTVDYAAIPTFASDVDLDVTDQVLKWRMAPADNHGFALRTWDERTDEEDNNQCVSYYRDFALQVTEMPPAGAPSIDPGTIVVPGSP